MMKQFFLISFFLFASCKSIVDPKIENFKTIYNQVIDDPTEKLKTLDEKKITFSARQMPIKTFAIWFSDTYEVGFIYQENLSNKLLDLELKNATIAEVINSVSRFLNVDVIRNGNSYFVGIQKPTDKGVLVKKVRGVSVEDLKNIMTGVTGGEGDQSVSVTSDGVVFLIDKEQNLQPILTALEQLEQDYKTAWVVQLYLFDLDTEKVQNMGIDLSVSGNLAFRLLEPEILNSNGANYNLLLDGLVDISNGSDSVNLVSQPLFVMRDGKTFNFSNLNSFPYVQRITTQEGFVEDSDVEFIESGMDLKVNLREMIKGSLLTLDFHNSQVIGFDPNTNLPIRNIVTVNSEVPLHSSGIYLLCQSDYSETTINSSFTHKNQMVRKSQLQIYAKVFKLDKGFKGIKEVTAKNF
jgi:hypothetical protein